MRAEFGKPRRRAAPSAWSRHSTPATRCSPRRSPRASGRPPGTVQHQIKEMLDQSADAQRAAHRPPVLRPGRQQPPVRLQGRGRPRLQGRERAPAAGERAEPRAHRRADPRDRRAQGARPAPTCASPRPRRPGPARAAASRSASTTRSRRIAVARGDVASHIGAEGAEGGGKKGDTLVELGAADGPAAGRIVFEAKDRKRMSQERGLGRAQRCMAERAAAFAVLVVAGEDRVPAGREQLTEYEGNKMIVAVDRDEPGRPRARGRLPLARRPRRDAARGRARGRCRRRPRCRRGGDLGAEAGAGASARR